MSTKNHARAADKKGFSIALPIVLISQIETIAKQETRSRNKQIERFLSDSVRQWNITNAGSVITEFPAQTSKVAEVSGDYKVTPSHTLPFLGAVAAGEPVEAPRVDESLQVSKEYPPHHFIVEVNGESMEHAYPEGSRWIIDGRNKYTPKNKAVCVVSDHEGSYLKVWDKTSKVFKSLNPAFNHVLPAEEAKLQGYPVEQLA